LREEPVAGCKSYQGSRTGRCGWNTSFLEYRMFRREFFFPRASHRPPGLMFFEMLSKDCDRSPRNYPGRSAGACRRALQVDKGARGMPRLSEAKKDAASCDKPRGPAHTG